jgi:plastocyanin
VKGIAALLLGVVALTAACGDQDDDDMGATATTEMGGAAAGDVVTIDIAEFAFSPAELIIEAGQSVQWANGDDFAHTAESDGDQPFDTGNLEGGATSDPVPFNEPGTYEYFCGIHNYMTATVVVQ